jgi:hypothetical protein
MAGLLKSCFVVMTMAALVALYSAEAGYRTIAPDSHEAQSIRGLQQQNCGQLAQLVTTVCATVPTCGSASGGCNGHCNNCPGTPRNNVTTGAGLITNPPAGCANGTQSVGACPIAAPCGCALTTVPVQCGNYADNVVNGQCGAW